MNDSLITNADFLLKYHQNIDDGGFIKAFYCTWTIFNVIAIITLCVVVYRILFKKKGVSGGQAA